MKSGSLVLICCCLLLFPAPGLAASDDARDAYDQVHADLALRFDPQLQEIEGTVGLTLRAVELLKTVVLDLSSDMTADSAWHAAGEIAVTRNGEQLELELPSPVAPADTDTIFLRFHGRPSDAGGRSFFEILPGPPPLVTATSPDLPGEAHSFWPVKDVPGDKLTVTLHLTAPADLLPLGPGRFTGRVEQGDGSVTTGYVSDIPVAPHLLAVVLTRGPSWTERFVSAETGDVLPLEFHLLPGDSARKRQVLEPVSGLLAALESLFGPLDSASVAPRLRAGEDMRRAGTGVRAGTAVEREPIRICEIPPELPPCPSLEGQRVLRVGSCALADSSTACRILVQELARQWFGCLMTPQSPKDLWIQKGMGLYAVALVEERLRGPAAYRARMQSFPFTAPSLPLAPSSLSWPEVEPESGIPLALTGDGAWVLHMLRWVLRARESAGTTAPGAAADAAAVAAAVATGADGDETFFRVLRELGQWTLARGGVLTTEDFVRFWEESVPLDLHWFFGPWLHGTGRPSLAWDWSGRSTTRVHLHLEQTQTGPSYPEGEPYPASPDFYPLPWPVRLYGPDGDSTDVILRQAARSEDFELTAPHPVVRVEVDPDDWIPATLSPAPPARSAFELLSVLPDPSRGPMQVTFRKTESGPTRVLACDPAGRRVRLLLDKTLPAGIHTISWDGRTDGDRLATGGVYFIVGSDDAGQAARRVAVIR